MKSLHLNLNLTGVIVLLAVGVLVPVMLATAVGIVALVIARDAGGIVTAVLVISFAVTAAGSAVITVVLTGRKARLARMQADFVANVSHELRTPLSAIRLYAQTLQSGKLGDDPKRTDECLATILRETEWLDMTIDRVLSWRAASANMERMHFAVEPVATAVNRAVTRFRAMVEPDEVTLTTRVDTRLPVRHDAQALDSVLLNLLTNAYKYTGRIKRIGVDARDLPDGSVTIEVSDNGIGLTPSDAKRVFQPFYRAAGAESGASGVGLGLAIARYLVARHRGATLTVRSEKGRGSTFRVRLPAAETPA